MSTQSRASLALRASSTIISPADALSLIKQVADEVRGGGASLLTTGIQNLGAQVHIQREADDRLDLMISSGQRLVQLCTFYATVSATEGTTTVRIGGLKAYKTSQATALGFIPVGPKQIAGMSPYKRFLEAVAELLRQHDGDAQVTIAEATR